MKEKDFYQRFRTYIQESGFPENASFELKITKKDYINFSEVKPHQKEKLLASKQGIIVRLEDNAFGGSTKYTTKKAFDCLYLIAKKAYVLIDYYKPRKHLVVMVEIEDWIKESEVSKRKSLTSARALEIGQRLA